MRIVLAHNFYQQAGGEDKAFVTEGQLLELHGHEVLRYAVHNSDLTGMGAAELARNTLWNRRAAAELSELVCDAHADVVHFHNTFPLLSPAAFHAARKAGAAVVQTVQNYRLLCVNALLYRNGGICEDCVGRAIPWPGIKHRCYRGSAIASAGVASMLVFHRALRTWKRQIDAHIVPTSFLRDKLIEGGIPGQRIFVKGNFVQPRPKRRAGSPRHALFVGRLTPEKGVYILMAAWESGMPLPLLVAGTGPEEQALRARGIQLVKILGFQSPDQVSELMNEALCLVVPSVWYEGLPNVILEAFAAGVPVVASNLGGMASAVQHEANGLLFDAANASALSDAVLRLVGDVELRTRLGHGARASYEMSYSADSNILELLAIYREAIRARNSA